MTTENKETPSLVRKPAEKKVEEKPVEIVKQEDQPFDNEMVIKTWEAYKEERLKKGASDTEQLVLNRRLGKSGENNVKIFLESQLEISILEKFESDLIQFFRKSLSNTLIQVEKDVSEQEDSKKLYTSKEKFEYMARQNPALRMLKDRLGLDFEY